MRPPVILISALTPDGVIGKDGIMPWHVPEDLKLFKRETLGHPVIMGRKTWDSMGKPLPKRRNIVISRSVDSLSGAEIFRDLPAAIDAAANAEKIFVIGGAQIYKQALPFASRLYLSRLKERYPGNIYFPRVDWDECDIARTQAFDQFTFYDYRRKSG